MSHDYTRTHTHVHTTWNPVSLSHTHTHTHMKVFPSLSLTHAYMNTHLERIRISKFFLTSAAKIRLVVISFFLEKNG